MKSWLGSFNQVELHYKDRKKALYQNGPKRPPPQLSVLPVKVSLITVTKKVIIPKMAPIMAITRNIAPIMTANDINMAFSFG